MTHNNAIPPSTPNAKAVLNFALMYTLACVLAFTAGTLLLALVFHFNIPFHFVLP